MIDLEVAGLLTLKWPKCGQIIDPTAYIYVCMYMYMYKYIYIWLYIYIYIGGGLVLCLPVCLFERQKQQFLAVLRQKKGKRKEKKQNWSCFFWPKIALFPSLKQYCA